MPAPLESPRDRRYVTLLAAAACGMWAIACTPEQPPRAVDESRPVADGAPAADERLGGLAVDAGPAADAGVDAAVATPALADGVQRFDTPWGIHGGVLTVEVAGGACTAKYKVVGSYMCGEIISLSCTVDAEGARIEQTRCMLHCMDQADSPCDKRIPVRGSVRAGTFTLDPADVTELRLHTGHPQEAVRAARPPKGH